MCEAQQFADESAAIAAERKRAEESLHAACDFGVCVAAICQLFELSAIIVLLTLMSRAVETFLMIIAMQVVHLLYVTLPVGYYCGWLSHKWLYGTTIPVRRMTICLVLIAESVLIGWQIVLFAPLIYR